MAESKIRNDLPYDRHLIILNNLIMLRVVWHSFSSPFFRQPAPLPRLKCLFRIFQNTPGVFFRTVYTMCIRSAGKIEPPEDKIGIIRIMTAAKAPANPTFFTQVLVFSKNCDKMAKD